MIWAEAQGCRVVDSDGRSYIDLSGGFGVAALGHRSPEIEAAVRAQADRCVHALGDLAEADVTHQLVRVQWLLDVQQLVIVERTQRGLVGRPLVGAIGIDRER